MKLTMENGKKMKKLMAEDLKGSPLHFDLMIDGDVISYRLICPICGFDTFVVSLDKKWGGCANENCEGVCFEILKTVTDRWGGGWVV